MSSGSIGLRWVRRAALAVLAMGLLPGWLFGQLPPAESLTHLRPAEGIEVELFASEPLVANPAAIDVDSHGRVWVAEITRYRKFAGEPPADRIKVLVDSDGDGRADRVSVFAEGVYCPMSICVAGTQVFVATSPDLWVYDDADGDLVADGPPRKLLTGFGGFNHDHGAHSLVLGPDHKWWMSHGDGGFHVRGTDGSEVQFRWGGLLRGELDGSRLELVARNFRNPYEVCVNSFGEAFLSDNDNDGNQSARVCWILAGGDYGWFGGPPARAAAVVPYSAGWHFRAPVAGFVPATLVTGFGSPSGMCFYEGDAFGPALRHVPWHCDPGPREVRVYPHQPAGYGYRATTANVLTVSGDDFVRPVDVCVAPDGSLLVADWYDGGVGGHAYNNPEQGRIYRLRPAGAQLSRREKPGPYATVDEAIVALASPNLATQYLARERLLAEGPETEAPLGTWMAEAAPHLRARALWVLDRLGGTARDVVAAELASADPRFRALAVRILARRGTDWQDRLAALVDDPAPEVRRELLGALAEWPWEVAGPLWVQLALTYDGQDRYQLETLLVASRGRHAECLAALDAALAGHGGWSVPRASLLLALDRERGTSFLVERLARAESLAERREALVRLATVDAERAAAAVWQLAGDRQVPAELRREVLAILTANVLGDWRRSAVSAEAQAAWPGLWGDATLVTGAIELAVAAGAIDQASRLAEIARTETHARDARRQALAGLGSLGASGEAAQIVPLAFCGDAELEVAAEEALARLNAWSSLGALLARADLPAPRANRVIDQMLTATGGALWLLQHWDETWLGPQLRERTLRGAVEHPDANVRALFERHLPPGSRPQRLGETISAQALLALAGDAARGERIFFRSTAAQCQTCHAVNGKGGQVGPDLSQIGRKYERGALLETILEPSKAIAPEYVPHLAETNSGQVVLGFLVERSEAEVVLKDAQGRLVRIPAAELVELAPQPKSLMPELVLRDVSAQDAADLLAYLSSLRGPP